MLAARAATQEKVCAQLRCKLHPSMSVAPPTAGAFAAALSSARLRPKALAASLQRRLPLFHGTDFCPRASSAKATKEGAAAVREAVAFLEAQARLPAAERPAGLEAVVGGGLGLTGPIGIAVSLPATRSRRRTASRPSFLAYS